MFGREVSDNNLAVVTFHQLFFERLCRLKITNLQRKTVRRMKITAMESSGDRMKRMGNVKFRYSRSFPRPTRLNGSLKKLIGANQ